MISSPDIGPEPMLSWDVRPKGGRVRSRIGLMSLLPSLVVSSMMTAAEPRAGTPQELIVSLYAHHQPSKGKEIDLCERGSVSRYCDATLTGLFMKDCACRKKTHEVCNLDWDPFLDAQDFADSYPPPRIEEMKQAGSFEVTISNLGERRLIYEMRKTKDGWRIANIRSPASGWSLLEVLSGTQK